jgi:hypothetical protein
MPRPPLSFPRKRESTRARATVIRATVVSVPTLCVGNGRGDAPRRVAPAEGSKPPVVDAMSTVAARVGAGRRPIGNVPPIDASAPAVIPAEAGIHSCASDCHPRYGRARSHAPAWATGGAMLRAGWRRPTCPIGEGAVDVTPTETARVGAGRRPIGNVPPIDASAPSVIPAEAGIHSCTSNCHSRYGRVRSHAPAWATGGAMLRVGWRPPRVRNPRRSM